MALLGMGITFFSLVVILKSFVAAAGQGKQKFNTFN
jgi:hypothetical protein